MEEVRKGGKRENKGGDIEAIISVEFGFLPAEWLWIEMRRAVPVIEEASAGGSKSLSSKGCSS